MNSDLRFSTANADIETRSAESFDGQFQRLCASFGLRKHSFSSKDFDRLDLRFRFDPDSHAPIKDAIAFLGFYSQGVLLGKYPLFQIGMYKPCQENIVKLGKHLAAMFKATPKPLDFSFECCINYLTGFEDFFRELCQPQVFKWFKSLKIQFPQIKDTVFTRVFDSLGYLPVGSRFTLSQSSELPFCKALKLLEWADQNPGRLKVQQPPYGFLVDENPYARSFGETEDLIFIFCGALNRGNAGFYSMSKPKLLDCKGLRALIDDLQDKVRQFLGRDIALADMIALLKALQLLFADTVQQVTDCFSFVVNSGILGADVQKSLEINESVRILFRAMAQADLSRFPREILRQVWSDVSKFDEDGCRKSVMGLWGLVTAIEEARAMLLKEGRVSYFALPQVNEKLEQTMKSVISALPENEMATYWQWMSSSTKDSLRFTHFFTYPNEPMGLCLHIGKQGVSVFLETGSEVVRSFLLYRGKCPSEFFSRLAKQAQVLLEASSSISSLSLVLRDDQPECLGPFYETLLRSDRAKKLKVLKIDLTDCESNNQGALINFLDGNPHLEYLLLSKSSHLDPHSLLFFLNWYQAAQARVRLEFAFSPGAEEFESGRSMDPIFLVFGALQPAAASELTEVDLSAKIQEFKRDIQQVSGSEFNLSAMIQLMKVLISFTRYNIDYMSFMFKTGLVKTAVQECWQGNRNVQILFQLLAKKGWVNTKSSGEIESLLQQALQMKGEDESAVYQILVPPHFRAFEFAYEQLLSVLGVYEFKRLQSNETVSLPAYDRLSGLRVVFDGSPLINEKDSQGFSSSRCFDGIQVIFKGQDQEGVTIFHLNGLNADKNQSDRLVLLAQYIAAIFQAAPVEKLLDFSFESRVPDVRIFEGFLESLCQQEVFSRLKSLTIQFSPHGGPVFTKVFDALEHLPVGSHFTLSQSAELTLYKALKLLEWAHKNPGRLSFSPPKGFEGIAAPMLILYSALQRGEIFPQSADAITEFECQVNEWLDKDCKLVPMMALMAEKKKLIHGMPATEEITTSIRSLEAQIAGLSCEFNVKRMMGLLGALMKIFPHEHLVAKDYRSFVLNSGILAEDVQNGLGKVNILTLFKAMAQTDLTGWSSSSLSLRRLFAAVSAIPQNDNQEAVLTLLNNFKKIRDGLVSQVTKKISKRAEAQEAAKARQLQEAEEQKLAKAAEERRRLIQEEAQVRAFQARMAAKQAAEQAAIAAAQQAEAEKQGLLAGLGPILAEYGKRSKVGRSCQPLRSITGLKRLQKDSGSLSPSSLLGCFAEDVEIIQFGKAHGDVLLSLINLIFNLEVSAEDARWMDLPWMRIKSQILQDRTDLMDQPLSRWPKNLKQTYCERLQTENESLRLLFKAICEDLKTHQPIKRSWGDLLRVVRSVEASAEAASSSANVFLMDPATEGSVEPALAP